MILGYIHVKAEVLPVQIQDPIPEEPSSPTRCKYWFCLLVGSKKTRGNSDLICMVLLIYEFISRITGHWNAAVTEHPLFFYLQESW